MGKTLGVTIDEIINALTELDENSRSIAIKAACEHLNINFANISRKNDSERNIERDPLNERSGIENITDIRTLKADKNPANAQEMACLVALYLSEFAPENEKKDEIETKDIEKYFKQASFPLPKVPGQVLRDAKGAGYFDSSSRGMFKLNPVGYNLAVHGLPRKNTK